MPSHDLSAAELARRRAQLTALDENLTEIQTDPPASAAELTRRARALDGGDRTIGGMITDSDWREVCTLRDPTQPGKDAKIFVMRMPAMFWRITGDGADLSTGSGQGMPELALTIAEAIASGLLGATDHPRRADGAGRLGPHTKGTEQS
jgi:hypothetical protein